MCRPVVKRVHTDCSFGLVCSSGLKCLLGMCPFLIILSLNTKQLVLTRLFTHASLINVCSSCLSHLCLMFYCKVECTSISRCQPCLLTALPCWPRFLFTVLIDRTSLLTVLPFCDLDCACVPWEKIKCPFHQAGSVPLAIMFALSLYMSPWSSTMVYCKCVHVGKV